MERDTAVRQIEQGLVVVANFVDDGRAPIVGKKVGGHEREIRGAVLLHRREHLWCGDLLCQLEVDEDKVRAIIAFFVHHAVVADIAMEEIGLVPQVMYACNITLIQQVRNFFVVDLQSRIWSTNDATIPGERVKRSECSGRYLR